MNFAAIPFPVYGVLGHPFDLTCSGHLMVGGNCPTMTLSYTSPRYQPYQSERLAIHAFDITTISAATGMPESDSVLLRMIDEQAPPIRDPFVFKGGLTIGKSFFEGVIVYYATPLMLSGFYLRSEYSTLRGHSFGPSCDELITLIEGLQVLNA